MPVNVETAGVRRRTPVAIVGMAALFPEARNLQEYWQNIIDKRDCTREVPASRWKLADYFDATPGARDKTYCRRGGFIPDFELDLLEFGLSPRMLESTDIAQLVGLKIAKEALDDAGYGEGGRAFDRRRTGVIVGGAVGRQLGAPFWSRLEYPLWDRVLQSAGLSPEQSQRIVENLKRAYPEWQECSLPGMLTNVIAGRIANRFDLGGTNCAVDAACASTLSALDLAISLLDSGRCSMMLTGGIDTDNSAFAFVAFSKTPALSPRGRSAPFDVDADGTLLAEGGGMLVLKTLAQAERDGDRIYAVIRGVGSASDGRGASIYAPRQQGQVQALRDAYAEAEVAPASIGLLEAHGTGTEVGDAVEFAALKEVFFGNDQGIALGSVKSQIGHARAAAGAASLIKVALALHHRVLPATINVDRVNPAFGIEHSAFHISHETLPWPAARRLAGVSAFGFGGTNYHVVLEAHAQEHAEAPVVRRVPERVSRLPVRLGGTNYVSDEDKEKFEHALNEKFVGSGARGDLLGACLAHLQRQQEDARRLHERFLEGQQTHAAAIVALMQSLCTGASVPETPAVPAFIASPAPPPREAAPPMALAVPPPVVTPTAPLPTANASAAQTVIAVVSEKTGFPPDVLDVKMDLEADLGIDSLKRVEIFGALAERYPNIPRPDSELLFEMRTLAQIVDFIAQAIAGVEKKSIENKNAEKKNTSAMS